MTTHNPALAAKVEQLRANQKRMREAMSQVRGKGYGLNAAVIVELDASGELARFEITEDAAKYNMESIASGIRRAFKDARADVKRQVELIIKAFETDDEATRAIREVQAYFGIEPIERPTPAAPTPEPKSETPNPDDDDEWNDPLSWRQKV